MHQVVCAIHEYFIHDVHARVSDTVHSAVNGQHVVDLCRRDELQRDLDRRGVEMLPADLSVQPDAQVAIILRLRDLQIVLVRAIENDALRVALGPSDSVSHAEPEIVFTHS